MAFSDEVGKLFGKGMHTVDKKTQTIKARVNLSTVNDSLEHAYLEFGKLVYASERGNQHFLDTYSGQMNKISALENQAADIRAHIDELNSVDRLVIGRNDADAVQSPVPQECCPRCGCQVSVDYQYCPQCGDNLQDIKAKYVYCPSCGTYYPIEDEVHFCIDCGSPTESVPVSPSLPSQPVPESVLENEAGVSQDSTSSKADFLLVPMCEERFEDVARQVDAGGSVEDGARSQANGKHADEIVSPIESVSKDCLEEELEPTDISKERTLEPDGDTETQPDVQGLPASEPRQHICSYCGHSFSEGDVFCGYCGKKLQQPA